MKITINSKEFLTAVQKIGSFINSNHPMPILQHILLTTQKNTITLRATNLEITGSTQVEGTVEGKIGTCIEYKMLTGVLKPMPSAPLTMEFTTKALTLMVGLSVYELPLTQAKEFPELEDLKYTGSLSLKTTKLLDALGHASNFASNDPLHVFRNVNLRTMEGWLSITATDDGKLFTRKISKCETEFNLSLPKGAAKYLSQNPFGEDELTLHYREDNICFETKTTTVNVLLSTGKYPNYNAVIPKGSPTTKWTIQKPELLEKIGRLSTVYAILKKNDVKFEITSESAKLTAYNDFLNQKGKEVVKGTLEGNPLDICFNASDIKEILGPVDKEEITIELTQYDKAGVVRTDDTLTMIMPNMLV